MEKKKSESDIRQTHQEWIAYRYRVHQAMYGKRKNNGDSHDDEMEDFAYAYIQDCGSRD